MASVGPKTTPLYVVAKLDDDERLSDCERRALILRRAIEIGEIGGRYPDRPE
jgi:hypothetical protein